MTKEEVRNVNELYKILLENYEGHDEIYICINIFSLKYHEIINKEEFCLLKTHFNTQRPNMNLHNEFFYEILRNTNVWFNTNDKEIRKKFIEKLIKITE